MSGDNGAMRILVVEDDNGIAEGLRTNLRQRGYAVDVCDGVASAWSALRTEPFDAVLLDLGLPDGDGSELLQRLRGNTRAEPGLAGAGLPDPATPVLIMTARDQVSQRIAGLNLGADDYLAKPFDLDELEARLRALCRRHGAPDIGALGAQGPVVGRLHLDAQSGAAYDGDQVFDLPPRELALFQALMQRPGHAVAKERLFEQVFPGALDVQYEAIEVVAYRLRKRLADSGAKLVTLRGLGYLIKADT